MDQQEIAHLELEALRQLEASQGWAVLKTRLAKLIMLRTEASQGLLRQGEFNKALLTQGYVDGLSAVPTLLQKSIQALIDGQSKPPDPPQY